MAQQTALDWFAKQIQRIEFTTIDTSDFLECRMHFSKFNELLEQAKAIEKEQIVNAHTRAYLIGEDTISIEDANNQSEQYYNEKYNK